jgi:hypothetical protein
VYDLALLFSVEFSSRIKQGVSHCPEIPDFIICAKWSKPGFKSKVSNALFLQGSAKVLLNEVMSDFRRK